MPGRAPWTTTSDLHLLVDAMGSGGLGQACLRGTAPTVSTGGGLRRAVPASPHASMRRKFGDPSRPGGGAPPRSNECGARPGSSGALSPGVGYQSTSTRSLWLAEIPVSERALPSGQKTVRVSTTAALPNPKWRVASSWLR